MMVMVVKSESEKVLQVCFGAKSALFYSSFIESEKVLQVCFGAKFVVFYSVLLKVKKALQVCFGAKFAVFYSVLLKVKRFYKCVLKQNLQCFVQFYSISPWGYLI